MRSLVSGEPDDDSSGGSQHEIDDVLAQLRLRGGRVTTARRLLVRSLFRADVHRTAEELATEIQHEAPDISLSTVYRNLEELERLGVVVHAHLGHGPATYHRARETHGHLVCERCGVAIEAPQSLFADLASSAKAEFGFAVDPRHFAVLGLCAGCETESDEFADISGS